MKITDRDSLTEATLQANINTPDSVGSWKSKPRKRAELVSQPAWEEIERLRNALQAIAVSKTSIKEMRDYAKAQQLP